MHLKKFQTSDRFMFTRSLHLLIHLWPFLCSAYFNLRDGGRTKSINNAFERLPDKHLIHVHGLFSVFLLLDQNVTNFP